MIKPSEYIINELKQFIKNFPQTKVRYENDTMSVTHFVEVVPKDVYHVNEEYLLWEESFFDSFTGKYPTENICFISEDAVAGIEKVDFELIGSAYIESFNINLDGSLIKSHEWLSFNVIPTTANFHINDFNEVIAKALTSPTNNSSDLENTVGCWEEISVLQDQEPIPSGNNNYALAA